MVEQEKEEKQERNQASGNGEAPVAEDRFRYIGFEVFPKRIREFWRSDAERANYLNRVRETAGRFVPLSRANSFVATKILSTFEKTVLALTSVLLVVAPFLPWFSFTRGEERFSYTGFSVLAHMGRVMEYLGMGAGRLNTAYILLLALMVICMLFGVATLAMLFTGTADNEKYIARLRRILAWQYLPIIGWVAFFAMAASPTAIPFAGSLGLAQVESTLNIGSLVTSSSLGFWLPFATLWVNAIKSNDL